jgi:hypothetical protein
MGNKNNGIKYPDPPRILSRYDFVQMAKNQIQWTGMTTGDSAKGHNMRCPYCNQDHAYVKVYILSLSGASARVSKMEHFDTCKAVETLWQQTKREQEQAMAVWNETIQRLAQISKRPEGIPLKIEKTKQTYSAC